MTSDNPVAFRRGDNVMWLKAGMFGGGKYVVYPLAPDVMYCYPSEAPWLKLASFDSCASPASQQMWWIARTLHRSLRHRSSSFRVVTTSQKRGILPQHSAQMSTLLIGSRARRSPSPSDICLPGPFAERFDLTSPRNVEELRGRDSRPSTVLPWSHGYPAAPARVCGSKARAERSRPRRRCVSHHPNSKRQPKEATAYLRGASRRVA